MVLSIVGIYALYDFVFFGRFADFVVEFLRRFIYIGQKDAYQRALETYQRVVRNYMEWYFIGGILLLFMIAQMIYLKKLSNFKRVN